MFYFGPYKQPGHYLFGIDGRKLYNEQEASCPWKMEDIDGVLQQNCMFKFVDWHREGPQNEGEALIHYRDGWTALSFWDRSVDHRSGCNSTFMVKNIYTFEQMVELSKAHFKAKWESFSFKIYKPLQIKNSLLCPSGKDLSVSHVPGIVHRTGGAPAEVLNNCKLCGETIGNWRGQWVLLDSWSESKVRESHTMDR
jgi:hypothetical protein